MFIFVGTGTSGWVSVAIFVASIVLPRVSLDYPAIWSGLVLCFHAACVALPAVAVARANSLDDLDPRLWSAGARSAITLGVSIALMNLLLYPSVWNVFMFLARVLVRWGVAVPVLLAGLAALGYWDWRQCSRQLAEFMRRAVLAMVQLGGLNNGFERPPAADAEAVAALALRLNAMPIEEFCPPEVTYWRSTYVQFHRRPTYLPHS